MLHRIAHAAGAAIGPDRRLRKRPRERSLVDASISLDEAHHGGKRPRLLADQIVIGDGERIRARLRHPFPVEVDEVRRLALGERGEAVLALPDRPARKARSKFDCSRGIGERYWTRYLPLSLVEIAKAEIMALLHEIAVGPAVRMRMGAGNTVATFRPVEAAIMQLRPEIMGEAFGKEAMPAARHRLREDEDDIARLEQRAEPRLRAPQITFDRPGVFVDTRPGVRATRSD